MRSRHRIRVEEPADWPAVQAINVAAFGGAEEADLVTLLREQACPLVSLVAERGGTLVGHILFTPVTLEGDPDLALMGLAPMAVAPDAQRRGIGGALVRAGLERCKGLGAAAVVVVARMAGPGGLEMPPARWARAVQCDSA